MERRSNVAEGVTLIDDLRVELEKETSANEKRKKLLTLLPDREAVVQKNKENLSDRDESILAISVYNEACCEAVDGNADAAFKFLDEAIELGFDDIDNFENDADFDNVRDEPRFREFRDQLPDE